MSFKIADAYVEVTVDSDVAKGIASVNAELKAIPDREVNVRVGTKDINLGIIAAKAALGSIPLNKAVELILNKGELLTQVAEVRTLLAALPENVPIDVNLKSGSALRDLTALVTQSIALTESQKIVADAVNQTSIRWRILGVNALTAIHWIVAGTAELLAILVPATVAAASWAFVWVQGVIDVTKHMQALFIATEATGQAAGQTMGELLGLNGAFQKAQNAANVNVYLAWGAALLVVKERFGDLASIGLKVGQIFDTFAAKMVFDFSSAGGAGGVLSQLLSKMIPDLVGLAQVFGQLGHAVLNFAAAMPGLAEVLLAGLVVLTKFLVVVSELPRPFLTAVIAIEEFMRWGGLLVHILAAMGIATTDLGTKFLSLQRFTGVFLSLFGALPNVIAKVIGGVGALAGRMTVFGSASENVASRLGKVSEGITGFIDKISFWQAALVTVAAVGLALLIIKLITATTAAQNFTESLQKNVQAANNLNILTITSSNFEVLTDRMNAAAAQAKDYASKTDTASAGQNRLNAALGLQAQQNVAAYSAGLRQQATDAANTATGALYLSQLYHITVPEAMALATAAGVNLSNNITGQGEAATILRDKIASLVQGFIAMGTPMKAVGSDMLAVAIQSGLAGTQVQKVNTAFDEFFSTLTQGLGGMSAFETSLSNIGTVVGKVGHNLSNTTQTLNLNADQFAAALKTDTGIGAAAWQNFIQVVSSTAPQLIDWLRTAGAEGALSGAQQTQAIKDIIAQLIPYAADSKAAQAVVLVMAQTVLGPGVTSFTQLKAIIDKAHTSTSGLNTIVDQGTIKMANMSVVAKNLGDVLNDDITAMFDKARLAASGASAATVTLTKAYEDNATTTSQKRQDRLNLIEDLTKAGLSAQQARQYVDTYTTALGKIPRTEKTDIGVNAKGVWSITQLATKGGGSGLPGFPGNAAGGRITDGTTETADDVFIRVSKNEAVLSAVHARMLAPLLQKIGVPGFAAGGLVSSGTPPVVGKWADTTWSAENKAVQKDTADAMRTAILAAIKSALAGSGDSIVKYAESFIGKSPYVWGGTTPAGWDCSGMTSYVYKHFGISGIPRTSEEQFQWVKRGDQYKVPGALAFFAGADGTQASPGHVGIVINGSQMVDAYDTAKGTMINNIVGSSGAISGFGIPPGGLPGGIGAAGPGGGSPSANAALARRLFPAWGSGAEWTAWNYLANRESGWNNFARNPSSGAYGIAQALPPTKYPFAGQPAGGSNPTAQIDWMHNYILGRYGDPIHAAEHEKAVNWYDTVGGNRIGLLHPGGIGLNGTNRTEVVLDQEQFAGMSSGRGAGPTINFYGTQFPTQETMQAIMMKLSIDSGVGP